jgi:peroxiredoxin
MMPKVEIDAVAPEIVLKDFHDREFRLSDLRGKSKVLFVFNRGFT